MMHTLIKMMSAEEAHSLSQEPLPADHEEYETEYCLLKIASEISLKICQRQRVAYIDLVEISLNIRKRVIRILHRDYYYKVEKERGYLKISW